MILKRYVLCCCLVSKSSWTLFNPTDYSTPGTSVHGILQARILEWVAISFSKGGLPDPGIDPTSPASPAFVRGFFKGPNHYDWGTNGKCNLIV